MRTTFGQLASQRNPVLLKPILRLALAAAFAAGCAGGGTTSTPGSGGSSAGAAGASGGGANGGNSAGGSSGGGASGTAGTGGSAAGNSGSAGNGAAGNSVGAGGNSVGAGGSATGGSTAGTAGSSGGNVGAGGNASGGTTGGAQAGRGGASAGSGGASAGSGGRGGTAGDAGGATGTGGRPGACPPDASFCSGFETTGQPANSTYLFDGGPGEWTRDFAIDSTQKHAGNSSLLVKNSTAAGSSGSAYRMLGVPVPAPGNKFWVRFWVRSDMPIGGPDHNAFVGPADAATTHATLDSLAEDVGISFHTLDGDVTWPTGFGRLQNGSTNPYSLPALTWQCMEISYDLTTRHQQLYVAGSLLIDAANYPPTGSYASTTFATFQFGFVAFHGPPRQMWYDDVVVAPTRIGGCN